MADSYSLSVVTAILTGAATTRTLTTTGTGSFDEEFWTTVKLAAAAADISVALGTLTDPQVVIVIGGEGVTFKLGAAGTDDIGADPIGIAADEVNGLAIAAVLLSNSSGVEREVTVIAWE